MNHRYPKNRRGITLLFVISMIVLFLLMGTAFVVVANNFYRQSRKSALANVPESRGPQQGTQLIEEAFLQLVRGPALTNIKSPLRTNEILADQYGFGFRSYISDHPSALPSFVPNSNNTFVDFALTSVPTPAAGTPAEPDSGAFSLLTRSAVADSLGDFSGEYGGQVLTITSGALKGFSARIVSDRKVGPGSTGLSNTIHVFRVPVESISGDTITSLAALQNAEVIVNGRDFSGTGPAFTVANNGATPRLSNESLLPNRQGQPFGELIGLIGVPGESFLASSGDNGVTYEPNTLSTNEPWDAPDFNNMFLSGYRADGTFIPSFHRQSMVANNGIANDIDRKDFFFAFDEGGDGAPDVDVDGDGENEAFWLDLGFSIVTNADGKRFKPLVAYHVVDLDGRLNLNAHGNLTQVRPISATAFVDDSYINIGQVSLGGTAPTTPRGSGWGPPSVDMQPAFTNGAGINAFAFFNNLLEERYGPDDVPGDGTAAVNSFRSRAKFFGYPVNTVNLTTNNHGTVGRLFASSPMDLHDRFRISTPASSLVDLDGDGTHDLTGGRDFFVDRNYGTAFPNSMPEIDMLVSRFTGNEFFNSPYEMSLNGAGAGDSPFQAAELERLLRPNDIDSEGLPDRLWRLAEHSGIGIGIAPENFWVNDGMIPNRNQLFTTDSFEVPMLYGNFVATLRQKMEVEDATLTNAQLEFRANRFRLPATTTVPTNQYAFAPELSAGLKMDINRPLGDGNDNNGNGVVDEPGEELTSINTDAQAVLGTAVVNRQMDLDNNGTVNDATEFQARDIFARHLYMLAMLLLNAPDVDGDGAVNMNEELIFAQNMAQWAVNVVDFRDPDSINTRFEYDPQPWDADGYNPPTTDGNPLAPNGSNAASFVWGCERPELLITETLAGHIRNTENLATGGTSPTDTEFDQRLRPEPFAYFEVYNPWVQNSLNQRLDPSIYDVANQGVHLQRVNAGGSPVWRFEVERVDPSGTLPPQPLRYVYMADPSTAATVTYTDNDPNRANQNEANIEIFFASNPNNAIVRPGSQAVIGTQGFLDSGNVYRTFLGRRTDALDSTDDPNDLNLDTTTHIAFDAANGQISRFPADTTLLPALGGVRRASIVFIDRAVAAAGGTAAERKFSLSDPFGGYPENDAGGNPATEITDGDGFVYPAPFDIPFDQIGDTDPNRNALDLQKIMIEDGTSKDFRTVRLQRLANPLLPWNQITNPYLTIDSMESDLISLNGATSSAAEPGLTAPTGGGNLSAASHERGANEPGQPRRLWSLQRGATVRGPLVNAGVPATGSHFFDERLQESLGKTNDAWTAGANPFPWLTWNNRPFVSHLEIMNVPYLPQDRLTYAPELSPIPTMFTIDDGSIVDPYRTSRGNSLSGRYGHLLNFFGDDALDGNATDDFAEAYRLLEYIEVPSRFVGTTSQFLPNAVAQHPFNEISRYRVPGKVNLNTIPPTDATSSLIWEIINGGYGVGWNEYKDSLHGIAAGSPTDVQNPFRPTEAADFMPASVNALGNEGVASSMYLRPDTAGEPLFDYDSANNADNSLRSVYFRNSMRTRMANLTTNRSSVFAVWINVGYFEVDADGNLVDTNGALLDNDNNTATPVDRSQPLIPIPGTVAEVGLETGQVKRNRGFFIFDRSIPVAYEPGKDHNVDKAIILKSIIE